jgi:hypothetical protein
MNVQIAKAILSPDTGLILEESALECVAADAEKNTDWVRWSCSGRSRI